MMNIKTLLLFVPLFLMSCMTTDLVNHNDLRDNSRRYLINRDFSFFNKNPNLSFGSYRTKLIESGNSSYKYSLYDSLDNGVLISCSPFKNGEHFKLDDISLFGDTKDEYYIRVFHNDTQIIDLKYEGRFNTTFDYNGEQYRLIEEDESDYSSNSLFTGYVIKSKGITLAAMNQGDSEIIWLHNSIEREEEMALSGILTAMSLKPVYTED